MEGVVTHHRFEQVNTLFDIHGKYTKVTGVYNVEHPPPPVGGKWKKKFWDGEDNQRVEKIVFGYYNNILHYFDHIYTIFTLYGEENQTIIWLVGEGNQRPGGRDKIKGRSTLYSPAKSSISWHSKIILTVPTDLFNVSWLNQVVLIFIAASSTALAMERPNIPPDSIVSIHGDVEIQLSSSYILSFCSASNEAEYTQPIRTI